MIDVRDYNAFKAAMSRAGRLGFGRSSMDGVINYIEGVRKFGTSLDQHQVARLVDAIPAAKRAKYLDAICEVAKLCMMDLPGARQMINLVGYEPVRAAIDDFFSPLNKGMFNGERNRSGDLRTSFANAMDVANTAVTQESIRVQNVNNHMTHLLNAYRGERLCLTNNNTMEPTSYGVTGDTRRAGTDAQMVAAARWVANASSTFSGKKGDEREQTIYEIARLIKTTVLAVSKEGFRLNSKTGLRDFYSKVVGGSVAGKTQRTMNTSANVPTLSDKIGAAMMYSWIDRLSEEQMDNRHGVALGMFLMGAIVGCHGFVDGNGRTARCCYAVGVISQYGFFEGVTKEFDDLLNGLKGQSIA